MPGGCYQGGRVSVQSTITHAEDHVSNTNVYSGHHVCSQQGLKLTLFRNTQRVATVFCMVVRSLVVTGNTHTHTHTHTHTSLG